LLEDQSAARKARELAGRRVGMTPAVALVPARS
jgi:hypothetical protein